jgi:epoxyqueuosine reductase
MTPSAKADLVKRIARAAGLDRAGIAPARPLPRAAYYMSWLAAGHAGSMAWLHRNVSLRLDPRELLEGARSIVCAALSYHRPADSFKTACQNPSRQARGLDPVPDAPGSVTGSEAAASPAAAPPAAAPTASPGVWDASGSSGRIAQYARGADYHVALREMLTGVVRELRNRLDEPFEARIFVDTGPLLERELAAQAGLGWIGKNTLLLNEKLGSYLFLGEIVTTLELEPDAPLPDHCGSCTRCLEACPTRAFPAPYQMDASRCISYLTIEHRGVIPESLHAGIGEWLYGCDICQEVCPFNAKAPPARHPEILADRLPGRIALERVLEISQEDYRQLTRGTAAARARRDMWQRNAAIVLGNTATPYGHTAAQALPLREALERASRSQAEGLAAAAAAALRKLAPGAHP